MPLPRELAWAPPPRVATNRRGRPPLRPPAASRPYRVSGGMVLPVPSLARSHDVKNLLIVEGTAHNLPPVSMADLGWRERGDLQRWVRQHPDLIEPRLLLVSEEFADWEGAGAAVHDRLDLLFLDVDGRPVVVELKRGTAPDRTESQALLYAAYCDQLSTTDLVEQYAKTHSVDLAEARTAITTHAEALGEDQPGRVRVRLVAEDFRLSGGDLG